MAVTTTPPQRRRCPLCLAILEMRQIQPDGTVASVKFDNHTPAGCEESTLTRIRVLEELHQRDARELESQQVVIDRLGGMIGALSAVVRAGRDWISLRTRRAADLARLRGAFGTADRAAQHPLWEAESAVAGAIEGAIKAVEGGGGS